jgi:hypothetical protein
MTADPAGANEALIEHHIDRYSLWRWAAKVLSACGGAPV